MSRPIGRKRVYPVLTEKPKTPAEAFDPTRPGFLIDELGPKPLPLEIEIRDCPCPDFPNCPCDPA